MEFKSIMNGRANLKRFVLSYSSSTPLLAYSHVQTGDLYGHEHVKEVSSDKAEPTNF